MARTPERLSGHRLTIEFSGERTREERSSTGYCTCGWSESASVQTEVRNEYRHHIRSEKRRIERQAWEAQQAALAARSQA